MCFSVFCAQGNINNAETWGDCHLVITAKLGYTIQMSKTVFYVPGKGEMLMIAVYWLAGILVLLVIEALTLGLTTIWFAGGALVAFIACVAGADLVLQAVLFLVVSLALLFFTRPFARRYINKGTEKTNVEGIIGREARVTKEISNRADTGEAVLSGQYWSARSADDGTVIGQGERVVIEAVRGVKLIVRTIK